MKNFKEWLSDYLRYIMLLLAAVLIFFLVMIGVRVYQNRGQQKQDVVEVYPATEALSESETPEEKLSERETESEKLSESESEQGTEETDKTDKTDKTAKTTGSSGNKQSEKQETDPGTTGSGSTTGQTEKSSGSNSGLLPENGTGVTIVRQSETERQTNSAQKTQTGTKTTPATQPVAQTERQTETEPPTETETDPPEPVYMTLTGSCYLRSGPGYEYEIIGEYMYGTTVQVLDDSIGWYKVQVDGMTGYMGGRFFH